MIRIGAEVKPNDILVGKLTPKSETELLPEERLLRAIFGDKASDVKDTSLRAPSGIEGIVIDAKVSLPQGTDGGRGRGPEDSGKISTSEPAAQASGGQGQGEAPGEGDAAFLHGKKLDGAIVAEDTGSEIIPGGKKITKAMIQKLEARDYEDIQFEGAGEPLAKPSRRSSWRARSSWTSSP